MSIRFIHIFTSCYSSFLTLLLPLSLPAFLHINLGSSHSRKLPWNCSRIVLTVFKSTLSIFLPVQIFWQNEFWLVGEVSIVFLFLKGIFGKSGIPENYSSPALPLPPNLWKMSLAFTTCQLCAVLTVFSPLWVPANCILICLDVNFFSISSCLGFRAQLEIWDIVFFIIASTFFFFLVSFWDSKDMCVKVLSLYL